MPVPWLRILKTVLGVSDFARLAAGRAMGDQEEQLVPGTRALGHLETRLAGVVVAALKEALEKNGFKAEMAEIIMKPATETLFSGDDAIKMQKLLDALENLDDVQEIYSNAIIED